jgi:hypothetical protein
MANLTTINVKQSKEPNIADTVRKEDIDNLYRMIKE